MNQKQHEYNRQWHQRNPGYQRLWKQRNPDKWQRYLKEKWARERITKFAIRRAQWLKRQYGLTESGFAELMARQDDCCAICRRPFRRLRDAHIDHCHLMRKVRGVLCANCNVGLGHFGEDAEKLFNAVSYLGRVSNQPSWRNFTGQ